MNFKDIGKEYGFKYKRHSLLYFDKNKMELVPFNKVSSDESPNAFDITFEKYIPICKQTLLLNLKIPYEEIEASPDFGKGILSEDELKEIENIQNEDLRESRENQLIFLANRKQQEKMKERIHKYSEELLRCEIEAIKRRTEQHDKNKNSETQNAGISSI